MELKTPFCKRGCRTRKIMRYFCARFLSGV
nr:MAG TPA: RAI1 like PD-(D/E)XK nuclease [Caudoviricetes sp.]